MDFDRRKVTKTWFQRPVTIILGIGLGLTILGMVFGVFAEECVEVPVVSNASATRMDYFLSAVFFNSVGGGFLYLLLSLTFGGPVGGLDTDGVDYSQHAFDFSQLGFQLAELAGGATACAVGVGSAASASCGVVV